MDTCDYCGKQMLDGTEYIHPDDTYANGKYCSKECADADYDRVQQEMTETDR